MRAMHSLRALGAILASTFLATSALANVIVVNAAGGGNFMDIQSGVSSAFDGDTILVKPGTYAGFTINGKSVTVVADSGPAVNVQGAVFVSNLSASQVVVLSGLTCTSST